jgi:DHA2 family multidrug resistance protein-like MFS transporter
MLSTHSQRWLILAILSSALFLIVIDMTVLYTALPSLTQALGATASQKLWIVNAYALVASGLLLGAGSLGDRLGHKRLFVSGLVVFGLASLLAAFSPTSEVLILARALLAVGAALMMPSTLSIVRLVFTDAQERAVAIGVWASVASGGAAFGPVLGGFLLEHFWWGSVFLINVPIVLVALVLAVMLIPHIKGDATRHWDGVGSLQVMVGLIGLAYAIKALGSQVSSWSEVVIAAGVATAFLALFVRRQRRLAQPMLEFAIFRRPSFLASVLAALVAAATLVGLQLVLSQRLQLVLDLSPLQTSLFMLPLPLAALVAGPLAGAGLQRVGAMRMLCGALLLAALGMASLLFLRDASAWGQGASLVLLGLGVGAAISAASTTLMGGVAAHQAGMAASVEEVSYELGGALGVTLIGSLTSAVFGSRMAAQTGMSADAPALDSLEAAMRVAQTLPNAAQTTLLSVAQAAFDAAYTANLALLVGLLLAVAVWVYFKACVAAAGVKQVQNC